MQLLQSATIPVPLRVDDTSTVRVGDSQVVLDVVIRAYHDGQDPESIVRSYPTLRVADVYAVIAFYLLNQSAVDEYLHRRREEAERLRQEIEARQGNRDEFRARMMARRAQMEQTHVAAPHR